MQDLDWRQIETAPKDRDILVWHRHGGACAALWNNVLEVWMVTDGAGDSSPDASGAAIHIEPTHWMKLPEGPSD